MISFRIKFFLFVLGFGISIQSALAQNGIPYISYLDSREGYEANNWSVCQDDHNAMLFASKKGLLRYDGTDWKYINIPYIPHRIKFNPYDQKVYIVSERNYGFLDRDERGIPFYEALTFNEELEGRIIDVIFSDSTVIFYGENSISCHSILDHQLLYRHMAEHYGPFAGAFTTQSQIYLNVLDHGLFYVSGDTLLAAKTPEWMAENEILFTVAHQENQVLIGTSSDEILVFDGKAFRDFALSNPDYLAENMLTGGLVLNDTTYVFSTAYGGVLLVDKRTGKVNYTLNYESGLPDDEIYAIGLDQNNGLWLTYGFGTCRVDMNLLVKDYSHYPGIEGLYTNALWYQGELYISSTEGLYCLSEVKNYEEVEVYLRQAPVAAPKEEEVSKRKRTRKTTNEEIATEESITEESPTEEKKGLISRLFKRERDETEATPKKEKRTGLSRREKRLAEESENDVVIIDLNRGKASDDSRKQKGRLDKAKDTKPVTARPKYVRKKVSKLKSIEHLFKKIEGLNSRCEHLISTDNGILAGSSSGLYLVNEYQAELLTALNNIEYISEKNSSDNYFILSDEGVSTLSFNEGIPEVNTLPISPESPLFSLIELDSIYWMSAYDAVYRLEFHEQDSISSKDSVTSKTYIFNSIFPEEMRLANVDELLFLFSESGIFYYSPEADSFLVYNSNKEMLQNYTNLRFFPAIAGQQWLKIDQKMVWFDGDASEFQEEKWNLFENITAFYSSNGNEYWIIDDYSKIFQLGREYSTDTINNFKIFLESVSNEAGEALDLSSLIFDPTEKMVRLEVSAPYFLRDLTTQFQYKVEEKMERWSSWSTNPSLDILLGPGEHIVLVRARNILGQESDPITILVEFKVPFYKKTWFYLSFIPIVLGIFYLFIHMRERKLRKDKHILELKVEERTREIQQQKQKIEIQKDEILAQKNDITSSITYASRIQRAILPSTQVFDKTFNDYFIFYKPRDIVSGDFYWISEFKQEIIFAVADCTGHGVPGAFMSMLGNSFLNEITKGEGCKLPANQILNRLRDMINAALAQSGVTIKANDGMDITLCKYNKKKKDIEYAGAYNPLFLIRKGVLMEYKADRMPIGFYPKKKNFKAHTIQMEKDDVIYLFSDGFHDQFGGAFSKKYTTRQFKQILTAISPKPMNEQQSRLEVELETWQGNNAQIDDILILGVRI